MATITKLPSGRWRAQVRRGDINRSHTFNLKREANDWATEIEAQANQVQAGGYFTPKGLTIGKLIKLYRDNVIHGGRTRNACLKRLQANFERTSPATLLFALRTYIDKRRAEGAGGVTIAQDLSYLATALDWGRHIRRFNIDPEVARDARRSLKHLKLDTRSQEREREPTEAELEALCSLWDAKKRQSIPMTTLVQFALSSAMRLGEICRIQIEDINFEECTVLIPKRKDPRNKESNDQIVPLVGASMEIIIQQIGTRTKGRIFPYNSRSVSASFTRACKALKIDDLHFHDLRHAATAELFRMGLDIPRVAMITGHKSWVNLRRYTKLKAKDVHNALS